MLDARNIDAAAQRARSKSGGDATSRIVPQRTVAFKLLRIFLLFLIFLGIEWGAGAFTTSLGRHPDAPSHFIGMLTIHNYLQHGLPGDPVAFAMEYYRHYPKVAIGHWPPFFHTVGAVWMLVFGVSKVSVFSLYAAVGAAFVETLWRIGSTLLARPTGFCIAASAALLVAMQGLATSTMLELPLALLVLWATLAMAKFLERPSLSNSLLFGMLATAAILTKGSALCLAIVPPIAAILARKPKLLVRWPIWASAGLTATFCLPWMALTSRFVTNTFAPLNVSAYLPVAMVAYGNLLVAIVGMGLAAFALGGTVLVVAEAVRGPRLALATAMISRGRDTWSAIAAALPAFYLFHILTPSGWEERYWYTVLGPIFLLGGLGAKGLAAWISQGARDQQVVPMSIAITAACFILVSAEHVWRFGEDFTKPETGMQAVAEKVSANPAYGNARIIVCCDAVAEGSLVAEFALRHPMPSDPFMVLRATKELAKLDWNGREKGPKRASSEELRRFLEESPVDVVVYAAPPERDVLPVLSRLLEAVRSDPARWIRDPALSERRSDRGTHQLHVYFQNGSLGKPRRPLAVSPF